MFILGVCQVEPGMSGVIGKGNEPNSEKGLGCSGWPLIPRLKNTPTDAGRGMNGGVHRWAMRFRNS